MTRCELVTVKDNKEYWLVEPGRGKYAQVEVKPGAIIIVGECNEWSIQAQLEGWLWRAFWRFLYFGAGGESEILRVAGGGAGGLRISLDGGQSWQRYRRKKGNSYHFDSYDFGFGVVNGLGHTQGVCVRCDDEADWRKIICVAVMAQMTSRVSS